MIWMPAVLWLLSGLVHTSLTYSFDSKKGAEVPRRPPMTPRREQV